MTTDFITVERNYDCYDDYSSTPQLCVVINYIEMHIYVDKLVTFLYIHRTIPESGRFAVST